VVNVTFSVREDLQVDAHLSPDWPIFDHALGDSISSLPPRGAPGNGPSTFWIDEAERGARQAHRTGDTRPFLWGNITALRVVGDSVIAKFDFDEEEEPGEAMPLDDFLALLAEWRSRVLVSATSATEPLPETYRRNPIR
jgi:hypothetical protein